MKPFAPVERLAIALLVPPRDVPDLGVLRERPEEHVLVLREERRRRRGLARALQRDQLAARIARRLERIAEHRVRGVVVGIGEDRGLEPGRSRHRRGRPAALGVALLELRRDLLAELGLGIRDVLELGLALRAELAEARVDDPALDPGLPELAVGMFERAPRHQPASVSV